MLNFSPSWQNLFPGMPQAGVEALGFRGSFPSVPRPKSDKNDENRTYVPPCRRRLTIPHPSH